ncbi:unnamed protein product [Heligmosomoides polygyrus]|uniref:Fe2OG dioxygenase domain-containing protein n=1 Tax=Heligmosomoides polygyrus TaxID=6339 RepID=A0A183FB96_HELPZ|nr:unnamed protein product [Heligmosomoides polygyrus]
MSNVRNALVLEEGSTIYMPSGLHRVIKLSDGSFCAVPIGSPEEELGRISRFDSATLPEHRSETAETVVYEVCDNYDNEGGTIMGLTSYMSHQLEVTNQPSSSDDEEEDRPMDEEPGIPQLQSSEIGGKLESTCFIRFYADDPSLCII